MAANTISSETHNKRMDVSRPVLVGYLWVSILGVFLLFSAHSAYQQAIRVEEYAYSCDPFGYLNTAKEIRQSIARKELPKFWVETPKTELLIGLMQSKNVPLPLWLDFVAPLAYHYFPKSGHVGCQYPPGAGLVLAMFPQGKAVVRLNKTVIGLLLTVGLLALILACVRQLWISAGFISLATYLGLRIIGRIGNWSFSINAALPALFLALLCVFVAFWLADKGKLRPAWFVTLGSGVLFGLGILIRLPVSFLSFGFLVLLWPRSWRIDVGNRLVPFAVGTSLAGVLPILAFQQYETGAWYLPSYPPWATTPPGLQWLRTNFAYYLGSGPGSADNWALAVAILGLAALMVLSPKSFGKESTLTLKRLVCSTLLLWGIPTTYFLTHETIIPYYSVPSTFGAVALLAFGVFSIEWSYAEKLRKAAAINATPHSLALSFILGLAVFAASFMLRPPSSIDTSKPRPRPHQLTLPPRLADERAWIWADFLTGTLWYYGGKPAFKITTTDTATRALVYRFVFEREEPQYLIQDSPHMKPIMAEISEMGGTLQPIPGGIDRAPYFQIQWPPEGPSVTPKVSSSTSSMHNVPAANTRGNL